MCHEPDKLHLSANLGTCDGHANKISLGRMLYQMISHMMEGYYKNTSKQLNNKISIKREIISNISTRKTNLIQTVKPGVMTISGY